MRLPQGVPPRFSTLFHIFTLALLTACTDGSDTARGVDTTGFRVALLTPGPISDRSWNGGAHDGLLRIRDSLGAEISHIQTRTPAEFEENFRQYGAQGYDLVFGHGFEFQEAALRVAPTYPATVFVTTSGNTVAPNVAGMVFNMEDASYLAGIIAASMTKTGTIATIGGAEFPPVKSSFEAFAAGARATKPSINILSSYLGTWDDVSAGKEQSIALINRGSDVIFQNADAAGLGIFQAAKESKGVYVFGANSNQNDVAPDVIIASVVIDLPRAFLTVAREVKERRFRPRVIFLGAKSGVVELVINPRLAPLIPPPVKATVDSVRRLVVSGALKPPRLEFVDTTAAR